MLCDAMCLSFKSVVRHFRESCLIRTRCGLVFHPFFFLSTFPLKIILLTVMNYHSIHTQQDGLVFWPCKALSHEAHPCLRASVRAVFTVPLFERQLDRRRKVTLVATTASLQRTRFSSLVVAVDRRYKVPIMVLACPCLALSR